MIQRTATKAGHRKTEICMILAVFFCVFTICIHMPDFYGVQQIGTTDVNTDKRDTSDSGNMASAMESNDLMFGSLIVNEMRAGSSQNLLQSSSLDKSAAPVLRFVFSWFVLILAVCLIIGNWYLIYRDRLLNHKGLYIVLDYVHRSDGKKSVFSF